MAVYLRIFEEAKTVGAWFVLIHGSGGRSEMTIGSTVSRYLPIYSSEKPKRTCAQASANKHFREEKLFSLTIYDKCSRD